MALALSSWNASSLNAADTLAIRGAKVITLAGEPIENGIIVISDGKIEAVGAGIPIPIEAHVIDAKGMVIMPGFVDPHSSEGMGQPNERNEIVPFLSVIDSIDPSNDYFEESRRNGITTAAMVPGNNTLIGGQAVILKTAGSYINDMLVKRNAGMKISLLPTSGGRMSQMAKLRRELDKARAALEKRKAGEEVKAAPEKTEPEAKPEETKSEEAKPADEEAPAATPTTDAGNAAKGLDAMIEIIEGKLPVFLYCDKAMDVTAAKQLVDEYKLNAIFVLGQNTYKAAGQLADRKQPVVIDRNLIFWETDPRTREDKKIVLPEVFRKAKVPFVFQAGEGTVRTTSSSSFLWYQAAVAVKFGTPESEVLRSMALTPAELLGIQDVVGSIEPGKDADLVILTGDPLRLDTWVDKTIVNGKVVYDRSEDTKLERLLSPKAE